MIFSITLLAMSLSLDALGVGVSYGLRKIKIPLVPKLIICLFSIFYSGISLIAGKSLSYILPAYISRLIGVAILVAIGLWIIIQALLKNTREHIPGKNPAESKSSEIFKLAIKSLGITIQVIKNPAEGDIDKSGSIDIAESVLLGLALSMDAIGVGIGSGLAGFHSMVIPPMVGLFQMLFLYLGTYFGEKFTAFERLNRRAISLLPGILLIFLAILRVC